MNAQTVALLQAIVRRESLSMLTYVGDAFPWTTSRGADALARLRQIVADHNDAVAAIGTYLTKKRHPLSSLGSYPSSYTTINFLSLSHILPKLVASERALLASLERDLPGISDKDAQAQVEKLLSVKKKNLESLEFLAAANVPAAAS